MTEKKKKIRMQTSLDVRRIDYPQKDTSKSRKNGWNVKKKGRKKLIHYYTRKNKTIMKIKNLYSFFTKLQTRIMNKTNIYHSQETKKKG